MRLRSIATISMALLVGTTLLAQQRQAADPKAKLRNPAALVEKAPDLYKAKLEAIEEHHDKKDWWEDGIPITDRPFQVKVATCRFSSSTFLLFWTPLLFSLMNFVLLLATWLG